MPPDPTPTKDRLLDAAERLFSTRSYDSVSIRDIASEADCNVAAVNYHFQSKDNLHRAVLERGIIPFREGILQAIARSSRGDGGPPDLEGFVRAFVGQYLHTALATPEGEKFLLLVSRLVSDPSRGGEVFFRELAFPVHQAFVSALREVRPAMDPVHGPWIMASLIGQLAHFAMRRHQGHAVVRRMRREGVPLQHFPALEMSLEEYIQEVIEHVTRFSVGGIRALERES